MCKENEVLWMLYGIWIFDKFYGYQKFYRRGGKASVDFNWKKGMNPFILGWMHSHPDSFGCDPSSTDNKTMRSWVKGKGKKMICGIYCDHREKWYLYTRLRLILPEYQFMTDPRGETIVKVDLKIKKFWNFIWGYQDGHLENA
jgi:hypothetical protein